MRMVRIGVVYSAAIFALGLCAYAQQPPERGNRPPAPAEGQPPPRNAPREEGDRPPPAKSRPRGKMELPDGAPPEGLQRGFSYGGFGGGGAGYGGFGGEGGYGGVPMGGFGPPGPEGMFRGPPDDPEMRELLKQDTELDRKAHELAMRTRQARGDERNKLKAELQEVVNKHFDARQKRRELQLKRMEEELQRLRDAISKRNDSRDSIVSNRLAELIGDPRDLDF